jgi:uncharacterized membrane protein YdbT with pleckstrin-like domain
MAQTQTAQQVNPNINDMLPSDLLAEDETVVFAIKPSLWTIAFLSFRTTIVAAVIMILTALLGPTLNLGRLAAYIIEAAAVAVVGRVGFALLQWVSRCYVLTDRRVIRIRGVFTIDIFQCALGRVQNTFLVLTLPQRVLGLGNIEFTTAGTGAVEAIWRHCRHPLKVHQQLIRAMNAAANRPQKSADNTL